MLEYHAAYYSQENGGYLVKVFDFPGVFSQGRNLKEARWMIRDALKLMAEVRVEEGKPLPRPRLTARDGKAERVEKVRLKLRFQCGAPS